MMDPWNKLPPGPRSFSEPDEEYEREGAAAAMDGGRRFRDCPYNLGTDAANAWRRGYARARLAEIPA